MTFDQDTRKGCGDPARRRFVEPSQSSLGWTNVLEAQLREAQAQLRRAEIAVEAARSTVTQREAERAAAEAVVAQREAELDGADGWFARNWRREEPSRTALDDDRLSPEHELRERRLRAAAAEAAIAAAKPKSMPKRK